MIIPRNIRNVLSMFSNHTAYLYGRTVRELLMGQNPRICRIITSAPVISLRKIFPNANIVRGKLKVSIENNEFIIISSRSLPNEVSASQDFTIDSATYSELTGLDDRFGAEEDIKNRRICLLKGSGEDIHTNPIIMMRAVRFCAELDFELDSGCADIIRSNASRIRYADTRKTGYEIDKLLMSPHPDYFRILHELNLLKHILPQLDRCFGEPQKNKYHIYDVGEHIMHTVCSTPRDYVLRWSALLHDVGKPVCSSTDSNGIIHFYGHHRESRIIADDIMHRYRIDRDAAKDILILIENHDVRVEPAPVPVKKMMLRTGGELFNKLMLLQTADNMAKNPKFFAEKYSRISKAQQIAAQIQASGEPYKYSQLVVNSRDLQKLGIHPGRKTNDILRTLMDEVIVNPECNKRDYLLDKAKKINSQAAAK